METIKQSSIYKIVNNINNKIYVGQTSKTIECRFKRHCAVARWKAETTMPIVKAISKYGAENFSIHLLELLPVNSTQQYIDSRETYWGHKLNSLSPLGYNLRLGNGVGSISEETRKKMSLMSKGRKASPETKRRLRESHLGYVPTKETREKLSKTNKGKKPHINTNTAASKANSKTTYLIDSKGNPITVTCMRKFCKEHGLAVASMSRLRTGKHKIHKGWKLDPNKLISV